MATSSSKWRALQRRHKWSYDAARFPPSRLHTLSELQQQHEESFPTFSKFVASVLEMIQLISTHAQVAAMKKVVSSFQDLYRCSSRPFDENGINSVAFDILVEILFLENSVPLHRSILSCLSLLPSECEELINNSFAKCLQSYGVRGARARRFALAGVASSVLNLPKPGLLKGLLERFCVTITDALSNGIRSLLREAEEGRRPSPSVMEECQGAMSCLYYMLQYYPEKIFVSCSRDVNSNIHAEKDFADYSIYNAALDVILEGLQTSHLSRDCCIAAGVGFCAASQFGNNHARLAIMLSNALFAPSEKEFVVLSEDGLKFNDNDTRIEIAICQIRGSTLAREVSRFTDFGRLCVFRGLLTAVPRPALNINLLFTNKRGSCTMESSNGSEDGKFMAWTILFDGILPAICNLCESSVDSHFKFHSVTALQICLQQIKTSINQEITANALQEMHVTAKHQAYEVLPYIPISDGAVQRILQIVWNNWEDPLNQTVKQIQVVFDLLVDIQCLCLGGKVTKCGSQELTHSEVENKAIKDFLIGILGELLSAGGHRKGRYVPLASLSSRLGSKTLLNVSPNLLFESIYAMIDDDVCCSASTFLKAFLERLREDCWTSECGIAEGNTLFRRLSLPPIIAGMVSGNSKLRVHINTYALPVALQIDSDAILLMMDFALDGTILEENRPVIWDDLRGALGMPEHLTVDQRVALLIGLLKVARTEALMEGDLCVSKCDETCGYGFKNSSDAAAVVSIKRTIFTIPLMLLEIAVTHREDSLRIDAAEALCLNPKTASMPSHLELSLLKKSIPLNMRCSSTSFRMKWTSLFRRFFVRVRTSVDRQIKADTARVRSSKRKSVEDMPNEESVCSMPVSVQQMQEFMKWFCNMLIFSIYPSAPYERKNMAMELIAAMFESWSINNKASNNFAGTDSFLSDDATMVLIGAIVDSWDKLREGAFRILLSYPTPFPGLENPRQLENVLQWAINLVNSPRVRECDAGALVLRLIFQKYVVQLGWNIKLHPKPMVTSSDISNPEEARERVGNSVSIYVESLNDWLEWGILEGEKNLVKACRHSFVHGALLSYRYTIDELDWTCNTSLAASSTALQAALARLLHLVTRVTSIALWVVSADALDMPGGIPRTKPFNVDLQNILEDDTIEEWVDMEAEEGDDEEIGFLAPSEQAIMVGCWLAMKEVSLLLGTITRKVPLPDADTADYGNEISSISILDLSQLELIGSHFLQVLLSMKHNGAIDKTRAGFVALCNRLLCSNNARLNKMPEIWLQQLMERTAVKGQTVDDLLRRSAGIPAAFLALFLSEPEGAPKKLLFIAMRWLIDLAQTFLEKSNSEDNKDGMSNGTVNGQLVDKEPHLLKSRVEGVVPTVHAFNVMRVTFNDTNLSTDSSGFCAEALSVSIQAFSCHHWEVRNAAILAFTSLLRRMVGFLNTQTYEAARRAITGFEFFHRYPTLHPFLLKELETATSQLENPGAMKQSGSLSKTLHPSLAPVLIILSRLKPSTIKSGSEDWLNPSAFMAYVSKCATQSNLKVRILASRALAPLVASEELPTILHMLSKYLCEGASTGNIKNCNTQMNPVGDEEGSLELRCKMISYNAIHGVLLQMHILLTQNCLNLPPKSILRSQIVSMLSPLMTVVDKNRIFRCPMVGAVFLQVLQGLTKLGDLCKSEDFRSLRSLLIKTSAEVLDGFYEINASGTWDSTRILLRNKACEIYFTETLLWWITGTGDSDVNANKDVLSEIEQDIFERGQFLKRLNDCISDKIYEVRLALLKVLKRFFDVLELQSNICTNTMGWVAQYIEPQLLQKLRTEMHPRCIRYTLLNYFKNSVLQMKMPHPEVDSAGSESSQCGLVVGTSVRPICSEQNRNVLDLERTVLGRWELFLNIYQTTKHVKTREAVICCLGLCIRQIIQFLKKHYLQSDSIYNATKCAVQLWLEIIQKYSMAYELVMLRRATAEAIVASDLLAQVESISHVNIICNGEIWLSKAILDTWFVCIKLLEDEDAVLREKLASAVLHLVSLRPDKKLGLYAVDLVPAQVEKVIHLCFEYLSIHFGSSLVYADSLANWVLKGITEISSVQNDSDLVRRLFDKEVDNHHEERLLFTQLCCLYLSRIIDSTAGSTQLGLEQKGNSSSHTSGVSEFSIEWRNKFVSCLKSFVEKMRAMESKLQWLGGLTNHPDVFKTLYPLLLGLLVFLGPASSVNEITGSRHQQALVTELSDIVQLMTPFLANPLIYNLLLTLLRQCESQLNTEIGFNSLISIRKSLLVEDFNPFFLL